MLVDARLVPPCLLSLQSKGPGVRGLCEEMYVLARILPLWFMCFATMGSHLQGWLEQTPLGTGTVSAHAMQFETYLSNGLYTEI